MFDVGLCIKLFLTYLLTYLLIIVDFCGHLFRLVGLLTALADTVTPSW